MKVFITGATGFVGTAVVQELLEAGHEVLGLARSEESAKKLVEAGAEAHHGNLTDFESLKSGARLSDAVIHLGFVHDFSRFQEMCILDSEVIGALGDALAGTEKPFPGLHILQNLTTKARVRRQGDRLTGTLFILLYWKI